MKNPKVQLKIDLDADTKNGISFIEHSLKNNSPLVKLFLPKDFQYILDNKFSKKEREIMIKKYTRNTFKTKQKEIKKGIVAVTKHWSSIEKKYFELINKMFNKFPWPKGKYIGYASIYHMFPRYIKNKTFFFPPLYSNSQFSSMVIAHELLHFIYFDYLDKKYKYKGTKTHTKTAEYVWQISEVFNSVIEHWEPYYKIFREPTMKNKPYTGQKYFKKMQQQWKKEQDIDKLLTYWMKRVKNKN